MSTKNRIIIASILVLLGVILIFIFLIYKIQVTDLHEQKITKTLEEKIYPADLEGKVYLTLKEKEDKTLKENKNSYGIYSFDLKTKDFVEEFFSEETPVLGGEFDLQGEKMLVSFLLSNQIYFSDKNKNIEKITNGENKVKKEAVWSNDGKKIAFMMAKETASASDINLWNIVVSDLKGKEGKVSTGAHPFFSPDGEKILFLKENGLNLINLKTKKEENVLTLKADPTFQIDLSLDKNRLAISDSLNNNITIYEISSWDDFQLEKINEIKTPQSAVSWPKFSPNDNKYLIYEDLSKDGVIQLIAYDLENSKKYSVLDLTFYKHSSMWVNDWR